MEREKVDIKEILVHNDPLDELHQGWIYINKFDVYFDTEKGYTDSEIIIQRLEDSKYFKILYSCSSNWDELAPYAGEVFPKEITTTIYE